jgi:hypothetical protein
MGFAYRDLDQSTRNLMIEEIEFDVAGGDMYVSRFLNETGARRWCALTEEAVRAGDDDSLARALASGCMASHYERRLPKSAGFTMASVPHIAPQTLAEGQFNMYYMRALGRRAVAEGRSLMIYRAKERKEHRPGSDAMVGSTIDARLVLDELRRTKGVEPSIQIPMPNTGLSVQLA